MKIVLASLILATASFATVQFEVPQAGHLGKSRILDIVQAPEDLARESRDDRDSWRFQAAEEVVRTAQSESFLEATCTLAVVSIDTSSNKALVRIAFHEGPSYKVGAVSLHFTDRPSGDAPTPTSLSIRRGETFVQGQINMVMQELQQFYRREGWLDAEVAQSLTTIADSQRIDVKMDVTLGRIAVFSGMEIRFFDQHLTPSTRITDLWPTKPGDTIRNEDLSRFVRKINQTRLFTTAKLTRVPARADTNLTDVRIDLKERVPGSLELSLSWEPKYGWGVGSLIRHQNIWGSFNALSLSTRIAQGIQNARLGLGTPLLLGTPVSLDQGLTIQQQESDLADTLQAREVSLGLDGTFSYLPTDWSTVSLSLEGQRVTKYALVGGNKVEYQFRTDLGAGLDFRDEPFDPISGWTLRSDIGWGGQVNNDTSFVWIQSQGRWYQPLVWRFLSAFAMEGGVFLNNTTLDGSKIFWLGGARTVRSYGFNELQAVPPPGYGLRPRYLRSSGELRMNLPLGAQVVGFTDWAYIWNLGEDPDLLDLEKAKLGYGFGMRYRLSLLSLRLDYCLGRGSEIWAFDLAQAI